MMLFITNYINDNIIIYYFVNNDNIYYLNCQYIFLCFLILLKQYTCFKNEGKVIKEHE
jgi:hypothetical protein